MPFTFRESAEDFIVEEVEDAPLEPDPSGTHLWFKVEKRGVSTPEAARRIAKGLGRDASEVSFAGRKDAKAVTRQRMSLEHVDAEALLALDLPDIHLKDPVRCRRKLRLGQLKGNRFHLRLTGLEDEATRDDLAERLAVLAERGVPNFYGEQRFGRDGDGWRVGYLLAKGDPFDYLEAAILDGPRGSHAAGMELLRRARGGTKNEQRQASELCRALSPDLKPVAMLMARRRPDDPRELISAIPKRTRAFQLAMIQARVFNRILGKRIDLGSESSAQIGDVVQALDGRHRILCEGDPPEMGAGSAPTGPLWSADVMRAAGEPGEIELECLAEENLVPEDLRTPGGLRPRGARRPLVMPLENAEVGPWEGSSAWVRFDLPVGSFATVVLGALRGASVAPQ